MAREVLEKRVGSQLMLDLINNLASFTHVD